MSHWVFNILQDHSRLSVIPPSNVEFEADILVEDFERALRAKKGDLFLTLNKNGTYLFDHSGKIIDEITSLEVAPNDNDIQNFSRKGIRKEDYPKKYQHRVRSLLNPMHEKLEDYTYSLLAIENYAMPYNHFKRKYTSLDANDYETIMKRILFISRTVFGRLFNCLPRENQFEVLLTLSEKYQVEKLRELGFLTPITFLKEYILENIIESGKYLVESASLFKKVLPDRPVLYSTVGFIEPESDQVDHISIQAGYFEELFKLEYNLDLVDELTDQITRNQDVEQRFEKLFQKRKWPINVSL